MVITGKGEVCRIPLAQHKLDEWKESQQTVEKV